MLQHTFEYYSSNGTNETQPKKALEYNDALNKRQESCRGLENPQLLFKVSNDFQELQIVLD